MMAQTNFLEGLCHFVEKVDEFKPNKRSAGRFEKFIAEMCERFSNIGEVPKNYHSSLSFAYKVFYNYQESRRA